MLLDMLKILNGTQSMIDQPYSNRKVARDEAGGLTISTVNSPDMGYETAILDSVKTHIVERYPNLETAVEGHAKWTELAPHLTEVLALGYGELVEDEMVMLIR